MLVLFSTSGKLDQGDLTAQMAVLKAENTRLHLEKQVAQQAQSAPGLTAAELYFVRNKLR